MNSKYRTVAEILRADTTDLIELAKLTGYPPEVLYLGANFDDVDLRGSDVRSLVKFGANLDGAILNVDERRIVRSSHQSEKNLHKERSQKINNLRVVRAREFIAKTNDKKDEFFRYTGSNSKAFEDFLEALNQSVLDPLIQTVSSPSHLQGRPDYLEQVISNVNKTGIFPVWPEFSADLFSLLGLLQCNYTERSIQVLDFILRNSFDEATGAKLFTMLRLSSRAVTYWIDQAEENGEGRPQNERIIEFANAARVTDDLVAELVGRVDEPSLAVELLLHRNINIDKKNRRRVFVSIVQKNLSRSDFDSLLRSKVDDRLLYMIACFGLQHGDLPTTRMCGDFIEDSAEGFGGIVLVDTIQSFPTFEDAYQAASKLLKLSKGRAHSGIVLAALESRATSRSQHGSVTRLKNSIAF